MYKINELEFDKSFNGCFNCFTARYKTIHEEIYINGSDEYGVFTIFTNRKFINPIRITEVENYINKEFNRVNLCTTN